MGSLFPYFFASKIDVLASLKFEIIQILAISKALESGKLIIVDTLVVFAFTQGHTASW